MISQVILHIGLHHTGTTSFQVFLNNNRARLQSQRVSVYEPLNNGINAAELCAAAKLTRGQAHCDDVKRAIHHQCNKSSVEKLIVSAECLSTIYSESSIKRLKSLFPVELANFKIILVLRDPEAWARRHWNFLNDEADSNEVRAIFAQAIDGWKAVFGDIDMLPYERSGMVELLCEECGIDISGLKVDYSYHRTSKLKLHIERWFPGLLRFYSRHLAHSVVGNAKRKFFNE